MVTTQVGCTHIYLYHMMYLHIHAHVHIYIYIHKSEKITKARPQNLASKPSSLSLDSCLDKSTKRASRVASPEYSLAEMHEYSSLVVKECLRVCLQEIVGNSDSTSFNYMMNRSTWYPHKCSTQITRRLTFKITVWYLITSCELSLT